MFPEGVVVLKLVCRRTVVTHYPFLLFWSAVAIPTMYWVLIVELGVTGTPDNLFSLTFGQVRSRSIPAHLPLV